MRQVLSGGEKMIYAAGIGPGDPGLLPYKTVSLLQNADVIAGFETVLEIARPHFNPKAQVFSMSYKDQPEKLEAVGDLSRSGKKCVVCFMGDPNFSGYELLERIRRHCGEQDPEVIPGISSVQMAATRSKTAFETSVFLTFHKSGNIEPDKKFLVQALKMGKSAIVIPKPWDFMEPEICRFLTDNGIAPETPVFIYEHLTFPNENSHTGTLADCKGEFSDMSIMVIKPQLRHQGTSDSGGSK